MSPVLYHNTRKRFPLKSQMGNSLACILFKRNSFRNRYVLIALKLLKTVKLSDQCSISKLQCHGITAKGSHIYMNPPTFYVSV